MTSTVLAYVCMHVQKIQENLTEHIGEKQKKWWFDAEESKGWRESL